MADNTTAPVAPAAAPAAANAEDNLLAVETLAQLQALPSVKIPTIVVRSKFIKKNQAFKRARD